MGGGDWENHVGKGSWGWEAIMKYNAEKDSRPGFLTVNTMYVWAGIILCC